MNKQELPELIQSTLDITRTVLLNKDIDISLRNKMLSKVRTLERVIQKSYTPPIFISDTEKGGEDRE